MKTILTRIMLGAALVAALALPGCKSPPPPEVTAQKLTDQLRETVSANVAEAGRKDQMLALIGQLDTVQVEFNANVAAFVASYQQLNTSYDTPRAAFDDLFKTYDAQRIAARDRFLAVHFQLTALATADEWKKIGKVEKKIYQELLKPRAQQEVSS